VALLPAPDAPAPSDASAAANQEQPQTSLSGRATGLVLALAAHWSEPNAETLRALDELYMDKVFYHGKLTPRQAVLSEKRRFAERWPQRTYRVRPRSLTASCNVATEVCRVQGIMDRDLANSTTNTKSHDETAFDYSIARSGEALKITAENTSVSKLADPSESNPLTSVQRGLARLLAQVSRIRQVSPSPPDGQIRPSAPIPH
jgi:hypothetical protein